MAKTVYVIEDYANQLRTLTQALERAGHTALGFSTVDAAFAHMGWSADIGIPRLSQNLPDMIITDNDTNSRYRGLDMLRAAKDANIPRIMMSAKMTPEEAKQAGGPETRLFMKPYKIQDMVDAVGDSLGENRLQR